MSCHARDDIVSLKLHHVMPGMTACQFVHDNVFGSDDQNVVWAALLVLADFFRLCWAKQAHSADRCCACWGTGLMLRAAVSAVRGVSFIPIHPLSGVYAGVIFLFIVNRCIWYPRTFDTKVLKTHETGIYIYVLTLYS